MLERAFTEAGVGEPAADAGILLEEATGLTRLALAIDADQPLGDLAADRLDGFARRRLAREPVFRIIGLRPFFGLDLKVTRAVLDPRPDTETVVDAALAAMRGRDDETLRVLDLGTGSGAILCALLSQWPKAVGLGVDRSIEACCIARANVMACALEDRALVVAADWADAVAGPVDVIVSNPPYIESAVIDTLDPEVRDHDPRLALDGGSDGLDAYRLLCPLLPRLLAPTGAAVFEVGFAQAAAVAALFAAHGLLKVATARDLGGHDRAVIGRRP